MDIETRAAFERLKAGFAAKFPGDPDARDAVQLIDHFVMRLDGFFEDVHAIAMNTTPRVSV